MDELDVDPSKFSFSFPIWIGLQKETSIPIVGKIKDGPLYVPYFSSVDLVEDYIAESEIPEGSLPYAPYAIMTIHDLLVALKAIKHAGYTYAAFDDREKSLVAHHVWTVDDLIAQTEKRINGL